jgi:hypothetical protein
MAKRIFTRDLLDRIIPDTVKTHFRGLDALVWTELNVQQDNMVLRKGKDGHQRIKQKGGPMKPSFGGRFVRQLIRSCRGGVSTKYIGNVLGNSLKKAVLRSLTVDGNNHEIVVITSNFEPNLGEVRQRNILAGNVLGFMILYTGECGIYPNIPALQIICSNGKDKRVANYLMYLYVKCLKAHGIPKGLLEVAGGYENPGAICLYNKFGFREDALLDTLECFRESANGATLAMSADLTDPGYGDIDQKVVNGEAIQLTLGVEGEPMCAKSGDVGQRGDAQDEYIQMRVENRKYLNRLFREDDQEKIDQLMDAHGVDRDLLEGDDQDKNYVKRELIKKGKKIVEKEKKTLQEYSGDYGSVRSASPSPTSPGTKKRRFWSKSKSKSRYNSTRKSKPYSFFAPKSKSKSSSTKKRRFGTKSRSKSKSKSPSTKKRRSKSRS